jgi:hypothetical protein
MPLKPSWENNEISQKGFNAANFGDNVDSMLLPVVVMLNLVKNFGKN